MHKQRLFTFLVSLLLVALAGCGPVVEETATSKTATFTNTNTPTPTPIPTSTQIPLEPLVETTLTAEDCAGAGLPEIACTGVGVNDQWEPIIREFDGIPMALVPAGCFIMGSTDSQIDYAIRALFDRDQYYANERPAHQQCFSEPFWIDVYEVTNGQYGSYDVRPGDDLPREYISWFDSAAHCKGRGGRLPTEAEWEYAARGPDSLIFPWGNEFDKSRLNYCDANCRENPGADPNFDDGHELTAPVGSYPAGVSWVGALDMVGNVWEWTSGILCDYPYSSDQCEISQEADHISYRTLRGGSWRDGDFTVRIANRNEHAPVDQTTIFGFRCTRDFDLLDIPIQKENAQKEIEKNLPLTADCNAAGLPEIACTRVGANDQWVPIIREFNGVEMVLVPAGCFQMGNDASFAEEQPVHEICFDQPYWIDRTEVTVGQFADFLNGQPGPVDNYDRWLSVWIVIGNAHVQLKKDGRDWYPLGGEGNRPIENVTWFGATDYCAWRQARLPTEAEWEYAARGPDNLLYPWGNKFDRYNIVRFEGRNPEVGSKPQGASWVGALDMSGSMFEWTSSLYWPYPYDASDGREASLAEDSVNNRVFKGCAWYHLESMNDNLTAPARFDAPPDYAAWYYGFRCARPLD